jgi:hypothetical protein
MTLDLSMLIPFDEIVATPVAQHYCMRDTVQLHMRYCSVEVHVIVLL